MTLRKLFLCFIVFLTACCPLGENCWPVRQSGGNSQVDTEIVASQGWYPSGSTIKLTFSVRNVSQTPLTLYRADGPVVDIVYSGDKTQSWSAMDDLSVDIHTLTLLPGETRTLEWEFTPKGTDGPYYFDGILWFGEVESRTPISVMMGQYRH